MFAPASPLGGNTSVSRNGDRAKFRTREIGREPTYAADYAAIGDDVAMAFSTSALIGWSLQ
jgi:hypothetical protein